MKRSMGGGAHRGPAPRSRQRRTLRLMQAVLVLIAAGLLLFAGYSWGRASGFDAGRRADVDAPRRPGLLQPIVLAALGAGALAAALALGGSDGIRIPTPARLDELAGRAESTAVQRAERAARDAHPSSRDAG
ncbi:MAG: hypothetical protein M3214_11135 [Actinomycetota bacterium]|nr:hypothetical protein [Actinomycetota bacterium]